MHTIEKLLKALWALKMFCRVKISNWKRGKITTYEVPKETQHAPEVPRSSSAATARAQMNLAAIKLLQFTIPCLKNFLAKRNWQLSKCFWINNFFTYTRLNWLTRYRLTILCRLHSHEDYELDPNFFPLAQTKKQSPRGYCISSITTLRKKDKNKLVKGKIVVIRLMPRIIILCAFLI